VSLRQTLEEKLARFEELENKLVDPAVLSNPARVAAAAREHGSLAKLAKKYRRFKVLNAEITETQGMIDGKDSEMREMAEAELPTLRAERETIWNELLEMTIGGEDAQRSRIVMEIRGGTGGDEAALFARDLYEMYKRHAETKGWKIEVLDLNATELGGFKEIILGIEGEGAYRELQYESGGHRVQPRARNRDQGPHPHLRGHRGRAARARGRGNRSQAGRLSQGYLLRQRPRRPARQ